MLKTVSFDKKCSHFQSFCMIFLGTFPFARIPICSRITCNEFWGQIPIARERTVVVESPEKADKKSDEAGADDQMEVEID